MVGLRLDPDEILHRMEEESRQEKRGKLKIYLGAAPGVGKTYTMLHDALELRDKDLDVVVGVAESHKRADIEDLLKNFEILPRKNIDYHGTLCSEFDIDAALNRNPGLILIDEMAHTNAPGSRHEKRWQDIKEFLDRGIDVYTTLNVQHIESLKDDVAQIIQAPIRETVPDSMIEMANTIEVVDLPPEELLKRMQEGKIYIPKRAELAAENFFRKGNLIALRELALRITAERVGTDVLLYRHNEGIKKIWPTRDKILVCVGARQDSLKLIRAAKRIVTSLQGEWIAVYVDSPQTHSEAAAFERNSAIEHLRLAEQLGAQTHVLTGFDIVHEIMSFAREQNITQIMVSKHILKRWQSWFRRNLADELVRHSGGIDVYMITSELDRRSQKETNKLPRKKFSWKPYLLAFGTISLATILNFILVPFLAASNLAMVYLLSLIVIARFGQLGLSIAASIIAVFLYDFLFTPHFYGFDVTDISYIVTLIIMLIVAQIISYFAILTRRQEESARLIQSQTRALYELSQQLTSTRGTDKLIELATCYLAQAFDCHVIALLPKKNHLEVVAPDDKLSEKEQGVAQWVYDMGQRAGLGTDTLTFSKALFLPLIGSKKSIGVLRIEPKSQRLLTPDQLSLLDACVHQVALSLDVDRLHEKSATKQLKLKTDLARISLLTSISNDLKKPLQKIGMVSSLLKKNKDEAISKAGSELYYQINKIGQLNNNILLILQLESQPLTLDKKETSLLSLIQYVIRLSLTIIKTRSIKSDIPRDLPAVMLNPKLIQAVLINLIDNADKFSPLKAPITVRVHLDKKNIVVSVEDHGKGIVPDEKDQLFEKFYQGRELSRDKTFASVPGLGLGLAVCQKVIVAHGGKIWVENLRVRGAAFRFELPVG